MADRKSLSRVSTRKKVESKIDKEKEKETEKEKQKEKKEERVKRPAMPQEKSKAGGEKPQVEGEKPAENGESKEGAGGMEEDGEYKLEPIELPPFEIIIGERMSPCYFKFQFRNVEYSSGRNKTFLCYLVDIQDKSNSLESLRGYLEDDHAVGGHAELAFFQRILHSHDTSLRYVVTWYMSSSPCIACAAKIVEVLRARQSLRLIIYSSRIFEWEEPAAQQGLRSLMEAGCKLRMMRPRDFIYTWDTFVENEEQPFTPWEDCQENYEYYDEKLTNFLK